MKGRASLVKSCTPSLKTLLQRLVLLERLMYNLYSCYSEGMSAGCHRLGWVVVCALMTLALISVQEFVEYCEKKAYFHLEARQIAWYRSWRIAWWRTVGAGCAPYGEAVVSTARRSVGRFLGGGLSACVCVGSLSVLQLLPPSRCIQIQPMPWWKSLDIIVLGLIGYPELPRVIRTGLRLKIRPETSNRPDVHPRWPLWTHLPPHNDVYRLVWIRRVLVSVRYDVLSLRWRGSSSTPTFAHRQLVSCTDMSHSSSRQTTRSKIFNWM